MQANELIRKYQTLQFLRQMPTALVSPIYAVFLLGKGLKLEELSLVAISFFVVLLIVELPTGLFADRFGRRKSMLVSCFIAGFAPLVYIWADALWQCMLAEAIYAISCGFYNGALDAWIKHELQCVGKDKTHLQKANARGMQAMQVSLAVGALLGGYLASVDMVLPWIAGTLVSFAIAGAVIPLMKENYRYEEEPMDLKDGISAAGQSTALKFVCLLGFLQCAATAPFNLYWQPFFGANISDARTLGLLSFSFFAVNFAGAKIAEKLFAKSGMRRQEKEMVFSQVFIGAAIILCVAVPLFPISLAFYVMHEGGRGVFYVVRQTYLQFSISKESQRAFVGSISSFFEQAGSIAAYLGCFLLLGHIPIGSVWLICGSIAAVVPLTLYHRFKAPNGQE